MSNARHYFVLGGAKSGKSLFAEQLAANLAPSRTYIATSQVWDDEMRGRVALHQQRRDDSWTTIEATLELVAALQQHCSRGKPVLVDCLTLWLTNLMMSDLDVETECDRLIAELQELPGSVIFVSNEVGQGIVPDNEMARKFRDHAGSLHQKISNAVDEVYFVTAGLQSKLKG